MFPARPDATIGENLVMEPASRARRLGLVALASFALAACYPSYDWRDYRPDCNRVWCDFVASFPGRVSSASRDDVPIGGRPTPMALHVVTVNDITFAIGAVDLRGGTGAEAARDALERKLLDDVGAKAGRSTTIELRATDRTPIAATLFEAEGETPSGRHRVVARFAERKGRLVEILVVAPEKVAEGATARQAIETFFASVRLD